MASLSRRGGDESERAKLIGIAWQYEQRHLRGFDIASRAFAAIVSSVVYFQ